AAQACHHRRRPRPRARGADPRRAHRRPGLRALHRVHGLPARPPRDRHHRRADHPRHASRGGVHRPGAGALRGPPPGRRRPGARAHRPGAHRSGGPRSDWAVRPRAALRDQRPAHARAPLRRGGPGTTGGSAMTSPLLGYLDRPGPLHTLSGVSKLVLVLAVVLGAAIGFDVRYLAVVGAGSLVLWAISRVPPRDLAVVLWLIALFMVLNNLGIFLFRSEESRVGI